MQLIYFYAFNILLHYNFLKGTCDSWVLCFSFIYKEFLCIRKSRWGLDGGRQENIFHQISYGNWRASGNYEMNEVICKGTSKILWLIPLIPTCVDYKSFPEGNGI